MGGAARGAGGGGATGRRSGSASVDAVARALGFMGAEAWLLFAVGGAARPCVSLGSGDSLGDGSSVEADAAWVVAGGAGFAQIPRSLDDDGDLPADVDSCLPETRLEHRSARA